MAEKVSNNKWFGYAVQALVVLAEYDGLCPSAKVAGKLESRSAFLRKILTYLVKAELVCAKEGRDGGYYLARPAEEITLRDVYEAMQFAEPFSSVLVDLNNKSCLYPSTYDALVELREEMEVWILHGLEQKTIAQFIPKE
ncbi:RrF2 family transcriptional regulator [Bacillus solimangrovi]|uniref:Transcriptional regulator n=1 Tax=Bacillus solimangrovi TaxID=1305675 RepID=A0A1E5LFA3_9BACI|nr:Rrf2 family transcriptional regulator [Bacillus solimangrovi]OEH92768.1 transcriptional regulator [Bacillus solimangrovi]